MESRADMFGAVRNEPDALTRAFFDELHAQPDLFQVVTKSNTNTKREFETFGDAGGVLPQMRTGIFDALPLVRLTLTAPLAKDHGMCTDLPWTYYTVQRPWMVT